MMQGYVLKTLSEELTPLGLTVSCAQTKAQDFGNLFDRLFMHIVRTSSSWKVLHILVVQSIILVVQVRKSTDDSAWPMVLWTNSTGVYLALSVFG